MQNKAFQHAYNNENQRYHHWTENRHKNVEITNQHQIKMTFSHENNENQNDHIMHDVVENIDIHIKNIFHQNEINLFDDDLLNYDLYVVNLLTNWMKIQITNFLSHKTNVCVW